MLSLGIDPGTATVGYGLVRELNDGSLESVTYGVITTPAGQPMWDRLKTIHNGISEIVQTYQPDRAAVEELFFAKNVTTAITVAQGRGVILLALAEANLPIAEYKPNQVKQSISGYGGANKNQMQEMVRMLLGLEEIPYPDDAADALAVSITDLHSNRYNSLY
ncbi:MAG: crossover junction endodeoxyribonuclease RuvC [Chitinophagaceae bacterium]|nr:crossover junction endodeoxyribonuclease RuvC [Anaerolineae bacterium]